MVRHTDAITGGAGSIMFRDDTKPIDPDTSCTSRSSTRAILGEKDLSLALALGEDARRRPAAGRGRARDGLAEGLGVPHTAATTKE